MKKISSCVRPSGRFVYLVHKPSYSVSNQRISDKKSFLGKTENNESVYNEQNLPSRNVEVKKADWVYEVANPFPFKGVTYINKKWADASAEDPSRFRLDKIEKLSLHETLQENNIEESLIEKLPAALQLALATTSADSKDLVLLAHCSCQFIMKDGQPQGLLYRKKNGRLRACIDDFLLFEAVANNIHTPDAYKIAMVIRPGAQGGSEIVGEWQDGESHAYEYLRTNSYIPNGHYAANMAEDAISYSIQNFFQKDISGLRRLYYQRTFIRLAEELHCKNVPTRKLLSEEEIEDLRQKILQNIKGKKTQSAASLWGWNFGFDYAASGYRLHASHQQVHQQYAMIPQEMSCHDDSEKLSSYCCGDLLFPVITGYKEQYGREYFLDYLAAIENNIRMDGREDLPKSLIIWSDENVILFVPKAQTSQWEVQLMTRPDASGAFAGNILECNVEMRRSLDKGILIAQKSLAYMGAKMVTSIEYNKRLDDENTTQPLIYALFPRLPESPGAFSEAQMRFITGHYPEDFANACRKAWKCICCVE